MKVTRFTLILFLLLCPLGGGTFCQLATVKLPEYEVATIKPSDGRITHHTGILTYPGGRIDAGGCTLKMLIEAAYNLQAYQVLGGPKWIGTETYDVQAIPPASSSSSKINFQPYSKTLTDEQRNMIQALLRERFSLSFHRESKRGKVLVLERNGKELKLLEPADGTAEPWAGGVEGGAIYMPTGISGRNISMPLLAQRLSREFKKPVMDETKLPGFYDFKMKLTDREPDEDVTASILLSLQGIGLKLRESNGEVESFVVEDAKRPSVD